LITYGYNYLSMSQVYYRKYRPRDFGKIIGQEHITKTLKNAVASGNISHAYLFAGPRGTGKTTVARIFAKAINCQKNEQGEPCLKCENCRRIEQGKEIDILEIDAASNTGVDNIRELREAVKIPPAILKYKVYIIDEVHMLSAGAFNALLKTLEEPPEYVIFIMATTEIQRIPLTIISRSQRFDFRRLTIQEIIKKLELISKKEKIKIERGALEIIAASADGAMRDAESLLSQIINLEDEEITEKEVEFILGKASKDKPKKFIEATLTGRLPAATQLIEEIFSEGADFKNFAKDLFSALRVLIALKVNPDTKKIFSHELTQEDLQEYLSLADKLELREMVNFAERLQKNLELFKSSNITHLFLLVTLGELSEYLPVESKQKAIEIQEQKKIETDKILKKPNTTQQASTFPLKKNELSDESRNEKDFRDDEENIEKVLINWLKICDALKKYNHSLCSILKTSIPERIEKDKLIIKTKFDFYRDRLNETKSRLTIEDTLAKVAGLNLKVIALTDKELEESNTTGTDEKEDNLVKEALRIIGGRIIE